MQPSWMKQIGKIWVGVLCNTRATIKKTWKVRRYCNIHLILKTIGIGRSCQFSGSRTGRNTQNFHTTFSNTFCDISAELLLQTRLTNLVGYQETDFIIVKRKQFSLLGSTTPFFSYFWRWYDLRSSPLMLTLPKILSRYPSCCQVGLGRLTTSQP